MKTTTGKLGFNKGWLIGSVLVVVVLVIVLFLTFLRVGDLQTTLTRPNAAGNASDTACFDNCFKNIKPGNGSYCKNYCATGGGGNTTCFDNCFKNIKPGNGSYCKNYCENGGGAGTCTTNANCTAGTHVCLSGQCTAVAQTHLECVTVGSGSACTRISGSGNDQCSPEGANCPVQVVGAAACQVCGGGNNFPCAAGLQCSGNAQTVGVCEKADGSTTCNQCEKDSDCLLQALACDREIKRCVPSAKAPVRGCWGNPDGIGGRCYDCNGDGTINILDFSCFAKHWLDII